MKRLVVVDTSVRVLYHSILVLSLYFLFAGHNQPGGGFVGGLTAGAAVSFRYVAGGVDEVRRSFPVRPSAILGGGLVIATMTALVPMLLGHMVLEHASFETELAVLGTVKTTSALPFDIGVYLVVLGLVLMMFEAFGDDTAAVDVDGAAVASVADAMAADTESSGSSGAGSSGAGSSGAGSSGAGSSGSESPVTESSSGASPEAGP